MANLKHWHWMLISLVVGALLAYAQLYDFSGKRITPDETSSDRRSIGLAVLMQKLSMPKTEKGYPWIADLTIYPAIEGKICVAGNELQPSQSQQGFGSYRPFQQVTEIPFKRTGGSAPSPTYSFVDYVKDIKANNPEFTYRLAWWANPPYTFALWMTGTFVVVGLLFPTFISVLQGTGFAPKPEPKEKKQDKPAYTYSGNDEVEGLVKSQKAAMTTADHQHLDELTSNIEKNLGGLSMQSTGVVSATGSSQGPIKQLEAKPLEQVAQVEAPKEDVDWGGEFYPVAHAKHKDEKQ